MEKRQKKQVCIYLNPTVSLTNQEVYDIVRKRVTCQELDEEHIVKFGDAGSGIQAYFFHEPGKTNNTVYFNSKDDGRPAISFLDTDESYIRSKIPVLEKILKFDLQEVPQAVAAWF